MKYLTEYPPPASVASHVLTSCYGFVENVRIVSVVVAELKFSDEQRPILSGSHVVAADQATLHERPEAFDDVRVDRACKVFATAVTHDEMSFELAPDLAEGDVLIGCQHAGFIRDGFEDECADGALVDAIDHAHND